MAEWSKVLPETASFLSPLQELGSLPGQVGSCLSVGV